MPDVRWLPVPGGLSGMRVDAGLAKLLGMSRTTVATMIATVAASPSSRSATWLATLPVGTVPYDSISASPTPRMCARTVPSATAKVTSAPPIATAAACRRPDPPVARPSTAASAGTRTRSPSKAG